jgi:hypothetical protein
MQLEQVKPNKPNFGVVVFSFAAAILAIFVIAVLLVLHYRNKQNPPYTKHPVSQLALPAGSQAELA